MESEVENLPVILVDEAVHVPASEITQVFEEGCLNHVVGLSLLLHGVQDEGFEGD